MNGYICLITGNQFVNLDGAGIAVAMPLQTICWNTDCNSYPLVHITKEMWHIIHNKEKICKFLRCASWCPFLAIVRILSNSDEKGENNEGELHKGP